MDKPFTTYEQQIAKLVDEKHLIIDDKAFAVTMLKKNSYFALINGYKELFKDKKTTEYKRGVCFEDIVILYQFDEGLRALLIKYILMVERQLKSLLSYYFSEKFGNQQSEYLNTARYQYSKTNPKVATDVAELISVLAQTLNSRKYRYINHNTNAHKNVPLWVLINALSFGKVSKMFELCLPSVQQKVCSEYSTITISEMTNILSVLTKFRNVCAHNERLYNYYTKDTLPNMTIHKNMNLSKTKNGTYAKGINDLFSIVLIFKCLLPAEDFINFFTEIDKLITCFNFKSNVVNRVSVVSAMGFPHNWRDVLNCTNNPLKSIN